MTMTLSAAMGAAAIWLAGMALPDEPRRNAN